MAIHWQVKFKSLHAGEQYTVSIYDDDYSGSTPVQLTGADSPFVTDEDDGSDWFMPVRTSSGYLNIFDDGYDRDGNVFDWRNLIPATETSRKVVLTDHLNHVMWVGYIQPTTFDGQLYEDSQERSFPVCDALSVLKSQDPLTDIRDAGMCNFAFLLYYVTPAMTGVQEFCFSGGTDTQEMLRKRVETSNFYELDENNVLQPKYTRFELLEEICRFWGWTCRQHGNTLYFVSPDLPWNTEFINYDEQGFYELAEGSDNPHYNTDQYQLLNIGGSVYASSDNRIEYLRGIRKATVEADVNKKEIIFRVPFDKILEIYKANTVQYEHTPSANYPQHWLFWLKKIDASRGSYNLGDFTVYTRQDTTTGSSVVIDDTFTADNSMMQKHRYNWNTCFAVYSSQQGYQPRCFRIVSNTPMDFQDGTFYISGKLSQVYYENSERKQYTAAGRMLCYFHIGEYYWTGRYFTNNYDDLPSFFMSIGIEGQLTSTGEGQIIDTRYYTTDEGEYSGYGMQLMSNYSHLAGTVEFEIVKIELDDNHSQTPPRIYFSDIELGFVRRRDIADFNEKGKNVYTGTTNKAFREDVEVSTIFASDNNNPCGSGIIRNTDDKYCTGVNYVLAGTTVYERPEKQLLKRILSRGSSVKAQRKVRVRSDLVDVSPIHTCEQGYPIAISRDWREDETVITIQQY